MQTIHKYHPYGTIREMCYAVQEAAEDTGYGRLTARPWDRFNPDTTDWWLVGSTDWPCYGEVKCFFYDGDLRPGDFATVHVEKGIDPSVGEAFSSKRASTHSMADGWVWHRFVERLRDGSLFDAVNEIAVGTDTRMLFSLLGGYLDQPDQFDRMDPDSLLEWDRALHAWDPQRGKLKALRYKPRSRALNNFGATLSPSAYTERLLEDAANPWTWIDVRVGTSLLRQEEGEEPCLESEEIWFAVLEPLMELLA
jgi:hypothetical protein